MGRVATLLVLLSAGSAVLGQPEPRPDPRFGLGAQIRMKKVRDIMLKRERGEPLTKEEEMLLRRMAQARMMGPGRELFGPDPKGFIRYPMNVIDASYFAIAEIEVGRGNHPEAVTELEKIIKNSPDTEAVAATHFNLAAIYRRYQKDPAKALGEYRKVTGWLKPRAVQEMIAILEETGEVEAAVTELNQIIDETENKHEKAGFLQLLADLYKRNGKEDEAVETLRRIPKMIDYREATTPREGLGERPR